MIPFHMRKWIKIKPAIWITFIPAKMHKNQPAITAKSLQKLALYLLGNVSNEFSYNSLKKLFNFRSVNTPISYISYMEDSYLFCTVQKFGYSLKNRQSMKKRFTQLTTDLSYAIPRRCHLIREECSKIW